MLFFLARIIYRVTFQYLSKYFGTQLASESDLLLFHIDTATKVLKAINLFFNTEFPETLKLAVVT